MQARECRQRDVPVDKGEINDSSLRYCRPCRSSRRTPISFELQKQYRARSIPYPVRYLPPPAVTGLLFAPGRDGGLQFRNLLAVVGAWLPVDGLALELAREAMLLPSVIADH